MSKVKEMFDAGELEATIEELTREVKANPLDATRRTFLFELLCFAGDWTRAEKQLDVIANGSVQADLGVEIYRRNIRAERDRRRLFADGLQPNFMSEPPIYVNHLLMAINRLREENTAEARRALDRAEAERPALPGRLAGKLNGEFNPREFQDFRDYDDLFGPVLEIFVEDKYTWLPLAQIKRLEVGKPKQLRDFIWSAARVETTNNMSGEFFLPALYPRSSEHANEQVRLGRMTDWTEISSDVYVSAGLHLFLVDDEERTIFELNTVEFGDAESEAELLLA